MNKLLLTMVAVALGTCAASAAPEVIYDLQFGKDVNVDNKYYPNNNGYLDTQTYTLSPTETFSLYGFNNANNGWDHIRCGRKNTESVATITSDFKSAAEISSIVLGVDVTKANNVKKFTLETSTDATTWTQVAEATEANVVDAALTLTIPTPAENLYYKISIDCASASANGNIHLFSVKYYGEKPANAKDPAGLAFSKKAYYAANNEQYFSDAILINPNNLPVTYSSSNPAVAEYVDGRGIKINGVGTTTITATSAETETYAAGEASYTLTIMQPANSLTKMIELAPNKGDKTFVTTNLTVVYVNGQYIYCIDDYDNPVLLYGTNSYTKGDYLNAGWVAENATYSGLLEWKGDLPRVITNIESYLPGYETLTSFTAADVNKVVYLKNIKFDAETPAKGQNVTITLENGSEIAVRNQFGIAQMPAGTYDLLVAVGQYNTTLQLYLCEINEVQEERKEPTFPAEFKVTTNSEAVTVTQGKDGSGAWEIKINGTTKNNSLEITIDTPEGYDGLMFDLSGTENGEIQPLRANAAYWSPVSMMTQQGYVKGNTFTVDTYKYTQDINMVLVWDNKVDTANQVAVYVKVEKDENTAVEAIEVAEDAEYYNLQGVKVENPADGIFVKVVNGKATKVVL